MLFSVAKKYPTHVMSITGSSAHNVSPSHSLERPSSLQDYKVTPSQSSTISTSTPWSSQARDASPSDGSNLDDPSSSNSPQGDFKETIKDILVMFIYFIKLILVIAVIDFIVYNGEQNVCLSCNWNYSWCCFARIIMEYPCPLAQILKYEYECVLMKWGPTITFTVINPAKQCLSQSCPKDSGQTAFKYYIHSLEWVRKAWKASFSYCPCHIVLLFMSTHNFKLLSKWVFFTLI